MRNEAKLTVYADVAISQIINEMGDSELVEILEAFDTSSIAFAISMLSQGKKEAIKRELKDEE